MTARFVVLRLLRLVAVLLVVSALCFLSLNLLPGDPARAILGESGTPESVAALQQELGLDVPMGERYITWLGGILQGDFGRSYANRLPVADIILQRAPVTIELILLSQLIALAVAIPLATVAAVKRGTAVDRGISSLVFLAVSVPSFVLAFVLIWVFAIKLGLYPANGFIPISAGLGQNLGSLLLPSLALAAGPAALYQRVLRADLAETYGQEFMNVARAKGVSPLRMAVRHAFRPSLLGLTTSLGVVVGVLIGSSVIIENLFSLPGLGSILATSVSGRDYVVVQGVVLVAATAFVVINAVVDLVYGLIDPRLRKARVTRRAGAVPVA
ncbi:ABC transporter permease [Herbidospora yilanensis]|uniref:ABC transporter permease n=1 Tax=Herbidospora yilanensis TaxID=354426 RepID=UPI0007847E87|nr:ABC transporter permease [Herbidospora yilanensis]